MDNIIGILILIASLIISGIVSTRKQKKNNKNTSDTLDNMSYESGMEQEPIEGLDSISNEDDSEFFGLKQKYEDEKGRVLNNNEKREGTEEEEQSVNKPSPGIEKDKAGSMAQAIGTTPKKTVRKKTKIQEVKGKFDAKKAIVYSEIINRKYF
jgi:hypothetical protein